MTLKLLFVDIFATTLNPTAALAPALLQRIGTDVTFFGPGLSSNENIREGLLNFEARNGPFDAVVFGPSIPMLNTHGINIDATLKYLKKFNALTANHRLIRTGLENILGDIWHLKTKTKIIWLLNFDYYATSQSQIDLIEEYGFYIIGPNDQFISPIGDLPDYARLEKHFKRKKNIISDCLYNWAQANPDRVIPLTHFVSNAELGFKALDARRFDVSVPGVDYVQRKKALNALKSGGLKAAGKPVFHLFRMASALQFNPHSSYLGNQIYSAAFRGNLLDTKYVYSARGGFGIPIRKFFEIPAAGALMLCVPPVGFEALGFKNGQTHIECAPEALPDTIANLKTRPEYCQEIAKCGRKLISRAHTLDARAKQLEKAIKKIKLGSYHGARWMNGEFILRDAI